MEYVYFYQHRHLRRKLGGSKHRHLPISASSFPSISGSSPTSSTDSVNDSVGSGNGHISTLMGRGACRLEAYNILVPDPIRQGRTRSEKCRMQAGEARVLLAESSGPELEYKVADILEDETTFLVTGELRIEPCLLSSAEPVPRNVDNARRVEE